MNIPAFPAMHFDLAENEHGMTLRDYFAAQCMSVIMHELWSQARNTGAEFELPITDMATSFSYKMADAMLKAREA
jgi:hypothetical protein